MAKDQVKNVGVCISYFIYDIDIFNVASTGVQVYLLH